MSKKRSVFRKEPRTKSSFTPASRPVSVEENLKRYALLVWQIHKRRDEEAIDRKTPNR